MHDQSIQDRLRYFEGDYHYPAGLLTEAAAKIDALRDALRGVTSPVRHFPCWCDDSQHVLTHGHQPKCETARAALTAVD